MKQSEIIELSLSDLNIRLEEEKSLLNKLKINNTVSTVENPSKITATRKTIARIKTELKRREIQEIKK